MRVAVQVQVRVEVLAPAVEDKSESEADGGGREQDSGGRWEREQRGREWDGSTGEQIGGAAEAEGVGRRDRYCTQED